MRRFAEKGDPSKLSVQSVRRVELILTLLDKAVRPEDLNLPGLAFHGLKGRSKGRYSVSASGNWRITFAWDGDDAVDVDLEDYH